jgi:glucosylceramidase
MKSLCTSLKNSLSEPCPFTTIVAALFAFVALTIQPQRVGAQVEFWLTSPDIRVRFEKRDIGHSTKNGTNPIPAITIDDTKTFQTIDGFGWCLTGGSAELLMKMSPPARAALLQELFGTGGTNLGASCLRVTIGASDLNDRAYSYDDMPSGEADPTLSQFSLTPDRAAVIPILKQILAINPNLMLLGSPWSAPPWMKDNHDTVGGSLKPEFQEVYARYLVKYLEGMAAEGIRINAITIQNEPLNPKNNPSMVMPAAQQAAFLKTNLGPAFAAARLDTKILLYDHNCDRPGYPISILNDPEARKYAAGSAFHLYAGSIDALTAVHEAHPDKDVYFTEQWVGGPGRLRAELARHVGSLIIGASRNWSRTVIEWNLASDPQYEPHTDRGGCERCLGAVTIDGDQVTRNPAYYIIAHASKFVRPGSVRIASDGPNELPNVAFKAPDGRTVLVVLNRGRTPQVFNVRCDNHPITSALNAGAVGTYVWPAE